MTATVARVAEAWRRVTSPGSRKAYDTYVDRAVVALGEVPIDEVVFTDLQTLVIEAKERAVQRRNSRDGLSAQEHMVAALRALFAVAIRNGWRSAVGDPSKELKKPERAVSYRHALTAEQLGDLWTVAARTGRDPGLDLLLLRLHFESGARREGALGLKWSQLRQERCCIVLSEKGSKTREIPCSPTLMHALVAHVQGRLKEGEELGPKTPVLRYKNGEPITRKKYETLFMRLHAHLPWAKEMGFSIHWARHHSVTQVEAVSSFSVAAYFAGHSIREVTGTYTKPGVHDVARAISILTGEPHPLAPGSPQPAPW